MAKGPRIGTGQGLSARKTESVARGRILAATTLLLACACAKQLPPPGGPEDRTAPSIISSNPESGAVGIAIDSTVSITFSESMQKDEVERALNIFPAPPNPPRLYWHENSLFIAPDTAWDSGRTYIVTLQGNARDRHNNRLAQSLQVAFSTGDRVDSGTIRGQIVRDGRPARNALALCYTLHTADPNPELDTADYVVQTDTSGEFTFGFLADATYRVFGLEDKDNDWLWTIGAEAVAVSSHDAIVMAAAGEALLPPLPLAVLDTIRPALVDCLLLSPRILRLEFDHSMDSARTDEYKVRLVSATETASPTQTYMLDSLGTRVVTEFGSDLAPGKWYVLVASGTSEDTCALDVPESWARLFPGETHIVPPSSIGSADGLHEASIYVSEPAETVGPDSVRVSTISDTSQVQGQLENPFLVRFELPDWVRFAGPVELRIPVGYLRGASGAVWPSDSAHIIRLASPFSDSTGEFELRVPHSPLREPIRLTVVMTSVAATATTIRYPLDSGGLVTGRVAAGDYTISLWGDRDGNGHRDLGWPYPFRPSEPVWRYTDTIQVRARFTTELTLPPIAKK